MGNKAAGAGAYIINPISENRLGGGQYADVYKVQKKDTKKQYAAKFINVQLAQIDPLEKMEQDRKLQILKEDNHPFVIKHKDEFIYQGAIEKQLCTVTYLANAGNLDAIMKQKKILSEDEGMYYFTMILIGLHFLHSKEIIHRDLKPENILIDKLPGGVEILVIGDFKQQLQKIKITDTLSGKISPAFMAPEMLAKKPSTTKVDMWALGVMLYQFVSNQLPFEAEKSKGIINQINELASSNGQPQNNSLLKISTSTTNNIDTMKLIRESEPAPLPSTVSPFIQEIITKLLDKNPESRPDAQELLVRDEIKPYIQKIITQVSSSNKKSGLLIKSLIPGVLQFDDESQCSINKEGYKFLHKQIKNKEASLTLHYRGSRDGWMYKDFYNRRKKKGATITLMQIEDGDCIGGFTNRSWTCHAGEPDKTDPAAVLFNLSRCRSFPCQRPSNAVYCWRNQGPQFGYGELSIGVPFNKPHGTYSRANGPAYKIPEYSDGINQLTNKKTITKKIDKEYEEYQELEYEEICEFTITEIELWGVTFKE